MKRQANAVIIPPRKAARRVDFFLDIAIIKGDIRKEILRQRAPIHAVTKKKC